MYICNIFASDLYAIVCSINIMNILQENIHEIKKRFVSQIFFFFWVIVCFYPSIKKQQFIVAFMPCRCILCAIFQEEINLKQVGTLKQANDHHILLLIRYKKEIKHTERTELYHLYTHGNFHILIFCNTFDAPTLFNFSLFFASINYGQL